MDLPRGRFTDALVALAAFAFIFVVLAWGQVPASLAFAFIPVRFLATWQSDPLLAWASPLASAFLPLDIVSAIFDVILLLIAGRFVERAIGPVGLGILFLAGAYAGAAARLALTASSPMPSAGLTPSLFAIIGAYLMLYGVPPVIRFPPHLSRVAQIGLVALFWLALQLVFAVVAQNFEISMRIIDPLGGVIAGVLLAKPLLALRYRNA